MHTDDNQNTLDTFNEQKKQFSSKKNQTTFDNDMKLEDATALLSRRVETFQDPSSSKEFVIKRNRNQLDQQNIQNLVSGLTAAADRLQDCFLNAKELQKSLHSLKYGENMALNALKDFSEQPDCL